MAEPNKIIIDGVAYTLLAERQTPEGPRSYRLGSQPAEEDGYGQIRTVEWNLSGPIGLSSESERYLGHDWGTLDTRLTDILTSGPRVQTLNIPGANATKPIIDIQEDRGYLFVSRGAQTIQINPATMAAIQTSTHAASVTGGAVWFGKGYMAHGSNLPIQKRADVSATTSTYESVDVEGEDIYAYKFHVAADRFWLAKAGASTVDSVVLQDGFARYTFDEFDSISNVFQPVPPGGGVNGAGSLGPYTFFGSKDGIYSFLQNGYPKRIGGGLRGFPSIYNGEHFADQFGWLYATTGLTLYALQSNLANPIGIESGLMRNFTGWKGRPTALHAWGEELLVAYKDRGQDRTHVLRGIFTQGTSGAGHIDLYPFATLPGVDVRVIGSTSLRTDPTILFGMDQNLAYVARDSYGTAGGFWLGSTMTRHPNLLKSIRSATFTTENMETGDSWQLAVSCDGGAWQDIGNAVTRNGFHRIHPVPSVDVAGHRIKVRLIQVAGGAASQTSPPRIRGKLTLTYDERPALVFASQLALQLGADGRSVEKDRNTLQDLAKPETRRPVMIIMPGSTEEQYGVLRGLNLADYAGDALRSAGITIHLWETG